MGEWNEVELSRIAKLRSGFPFKSANWVDEGVPVIKIGNVKDGRIVADGCGYVSEELAETVPEWLTKEGDVLIAMTGYVGEVALVRRGQNFLINQRVGRFDFLDDSPVIPQFLFYYFRQQEVRSALETMARGSAQPNLSAQDAAHLRVPLLPIEQQRAIAHILGTLDDKIELNRRQSETLQEMARALFKAWFVDFEPVRAKMSRRWQRGQTLPGLPAHLWNLFPDRLVETEHGEVPQGWRIGSFGEVAAHASRTVRPSEIKEGTPYIALEHMPKRSISLADYGTAEGLESNKYEFKQGEILFGKLRPYFHKVGIAPVDGVCSTDIVVIVPKQECWFGFVLSHASSDAFVEYTNAGSTGTRMPRTSWGEMARYTVVLPHEDIAAAFNQNIRATSIKIIASIQEAKSLAALRDTLLPKLLSGEMRVGEVDKFF